MIKKAIILPEVLKIIIAVICITLLLYLAFGLYGIFTRQTDVIKAQETLKQIVALEQNVADGQSKDFIVSGPVNWALVSYGAQKGPPICNGLACLCLCPIVYTGGDDVTREENLYNSFQNGEDFDKCNSQGICVNAGQNIGVFNFVDMGVSNVNIRCRPAFFLAIQKVPFIFKIKKSQETITLTPYGEPTIINQFLSQPDVTYGVSHGITNGDYLKNTIFKNCISGKGFDVASEIMNRNFFNTEYTNGIRERLNALDSYTKKILGESYGSFIFALDKSAKDPMFYDSSLIRTANARQDLRNTLEVKQICDGDFTIYIILAKNE